MRGGKRQVRQVAKQPLGQKELGFHPVASLAVMSHAEICCEMHC